MTATATLPQGWMSKKSCRWLAKRARVAKRIIEVGVWLGRSTKVLAKHTTGHVWAVDTWEGTPGDEAQHNRLYAATLASTDPYKQFRANLHAEIRTGKVIPLRMPSVDGAAHLLERHGRIFDFAFIDADHSYQGARGDIDAYLPLIKPGGILAGHDYHWPGVKQAVDEQLGTSRTVHFAPGSIWAVIV